jgi:hypothetical protein
MIHSKLKAMATEIITTDDLREFKIELITEFKKMLNEQRGQPAKKWLKSYEVKKLLSISPGTLQNLRINGTLPYTKIGGQMFYDYEDIRKMLEPKKEKPRFSFDLKR